MKKKRLIPVLLLKNGFLVQSKGFKRHQNLGNPVSAVKRLSEWASDELVFLDISTTNEYDLRRDDLGHPNRSTFLDIIKDVSRVTFMAMTVGGKIKKEDDVAARIASGADKVSVNTQAIDEPAFIERVARRWGSQCLVVNIDARREERGWQVYKAGGTVATGLDPVAWAREAVERGAGEILLQSIDRDGAKNGYDLELIARLSDAVRVPVIALGGCGEWDHMAAVLRETRADAVAAANVLHYVDQSVYLAKRHLWEKGLPVRPPDLLGVTTDVAENRARS